MGSEDLVLVHGAWHGSWCWTEVQFELIRRGHRCYAPTLTGLGERAHLLSAAISVHTHVQDIVGLILAEELQSVVLVGHSYAGLLITGVAQQIPDRIARLVYLDAVVPEPGESWSSGHTPETVQARLASACASGGLSFPPPDPSVFGLTGETHAWVSRRLTPHPASTYREGLMFDPSLIQSFPRTFIDCVSPALPTIDIARQRVRSMPGWDVRSLQTGHDPMISQPTALVQMLVDITQDTWPSITD